MKAADWIILRCGGKSTLTLADTLTEAGYEVWTPIERRTRRIPRTRKIDELTTALIPSFIFARARHMHDLLALSRDNMPYRKWDSELRRKVAKGHAHFSVFRDAGEVPTIPDAALAALRRAEARTAPKAATRVFGIGQAVKLTEGGFAGLSGVTEATRGQYTFVRFDGFPMAVQISTALLHDAVDEQTCDGVRDAA